MSRTEWILGIALMLILLIVAVFALVFWLGPSDKLQDLPPADIVEGAAIAAAPTSSFSGRTALVAFVAAQQAAAQWQPDAAFLQATATFPLGTSVDALREGSTSWTFTFYAASSSEAATYSVVDGVANQVSQRQVNRALTLLPISDWRIDSDEVIELFLQQGGDTFLSRGGVSTLTMSLSTDEEARRLVWLVSLIEENSGESLVQRYDARSGEVLAVAASP